MLSVCYRHLAEVRDLGAIQRHVPLRHWGINLSWRSVADGILEFSDVVKLRHRVDARTCLGCSSSGDVAAKGNEHVITHACGDCSSGALQGHDRAGAAMRDESGKAQVRDAEVVDKVLSRCADDTDGDHTVNLLGVEPGIGNRFQRGLDLQFECGLGRASHVGCLADTRHAGLVSESHFGFLCELFRAPRARWNSRCSCLR